MDTASQLRLAADHLFAIYKQLKKSNARRDEIGQMSNRLHALARIEEKDRSLQP